MAEALETLLSQILQREVDLEERSRGHQHRGPHGRGRPDRRRSHGHRVPGRQYCTPACSQWWMMKRKTTWSRGSPRRSPSPAALPENDTVAGEDTVDTADLLRVATGEIEAVLADRRTRGRMSGNCSASTMQPPKMRCWTACTTLSSRMKDVTGTVGLDAGRQRWRRPSRTWTRFEDGLDPQDPDSDGDTVADGRDPFPLDGRRNGRAGRVPAGSGLSPRCAPIRAAGTFPMTCREPSSTRTIGCAPGATTSTSGTTRSSTWTRCCIRRRGISTS